MQLRVLTNFWRAASDGAKEGEEEGARKGYSRSLLKRR